MEILEKMPGATNLTCLTHQDINNGKKTGWLGDTPVIATEEYPETKIHLTFRGQDIGITPMKGSKRGITANKGEISFQQYSKYEYEYCFARFLGKRIALWMNKNKKRVAYIKGAKRFRANFIGQGGPQVKKKFFSELEFAFFENIVIPMGEKDCGIIPDKFRKLLINHNNFVIEDGQVCKAGGDALIFAWIGDLDKEKQKPIRDLFIELIKTL